MPWIKKGLIYKPSGEAPWMKSHAQVPTALLMEDRIRLYIAVRPEQKISMTTYLDVDIGDPGRVLYVHKEPILPLGKPGAFDEFGMMPSFAMRVGEEVWLYYGGWNRGVGVPNYVFIGLAVSRDNGTTFTRAFDGPVMGMSKHEGYSVMGPNIMREGDLWRMWYGATIRWKKYGDQYEQAYNIFHATSRNGIDWDRPHACCIPPAVDGECTIRPAIVRENGRYHMWFCHRGDRDYHGGSNSYRIGYASSEDGIRWQRDDGKAGIDVSAQGWDSEMICYPYILETPQGRYMFYNGNGFGASGVGYAVWQKE